MIQKLKILSKDDLYGLCDHCKTYNILSEVQHLGRKPPRVRKGIQFLCPNCLCKLGRKKSAREKRRKDKRK